MFFTALAVHFLTLWVAASVFVVISENCEGNTTANVKWTTTNCGCLPTAFNSTLILLVFCIPLCSGTNITCGPNNLCKSKKLVEITLPPTGGKLLSQNFQDSACIPVKLGYTGDLEITDPFSSDFIVMLMYRYEIKSPPSCSATWTLVNETSFTATPVTSLQLLSSTYTSHSSEMSSDGISNRTSSGRKMPTATNTGMIIGVAVGVFGGVLTIILSTALVVFMKTRRRRLKAKSRRKNQTTEAYDNLQYDNIQDSPAAYDNAIISLPGEPLTESNLNNRPTECHFHDSRQDGEAIQNGENGYVNFNVYEDKTPKTQHKEESSTRNNVNAIMTSSDDVTDTTLIDNQLYLRLSMDQIPKANTQSETTLIDNGLYAK